MYILKNYNGKTDWIINETEVYWDEVNCPRTLRHLKHYAEEFKMSAEEVDGFKIYYVNDTIFIKHISTDRYFVNEEIDYEDIQFDLPL